MAQVRMEYLRWMTTYLRRSGIPACDHEQKEFRLLDYTSLGGLRRSLLRKMQGLSTERFQQLRDHCLLWVQRQDSDDLRRWFDEFDVEQKLAMRARQVAESESFLPVA